MSHKHPVDTKPANPRRKQWLAGLGVGLALATAGSASYYYLVARWSENTEDAYANGNIVQISAQTAGTVVAIHADNNGLVKAGQVLADLDASDARPAAAGDGACATAAHHAALTCDARRGVLSVASVAWRDGRFAMKWMMCAVAVAAALMCAPAQAQPRRGDVMGPPATVVQPARQRVVQMRYVVIPVSIYANNETGPDWPGSDEVFAVFQDPVSHSIVRTPGNARAALVSIETMRACG